MGWRGVGPRWQRFLAERGVGWRGVGWGGLGWGGAGRGGRVGWVGCGAMVMLAGLRHCGRVCGAGWGGAIISLMHRDKATHHDQSPVSRDPLLVLLFRGWVEWCGAGNGCVSARLWDYVRDAQHRRNQPACLWVAGGALVRAKF